MERPNICNLDEDEGSVRRLQITALRAAGEGTGRLAPKAKRAHEAYTAAMDAGESETAAIKAALSSLEERR